MTQKIMIFDSELWYFSTSIDQKYKIWTNVNIILRNDIAYKKKRVCQAAPILDSELSVHIEKKHDSLFLLKNDFHLEIFFNESTQKFFDFVSHVGIPIEFDKGEQGGKVGGVELHQRPVHSFLQLVRFVHTQISLQYIR